MLAERGHEPLVNNGQENDNGDGIEVLHQVVGNTVATHLTGLSDEVVGEVAVNNPVDGVESEDLASDESTLNFIDKVVVPVENLGLAHAGLVGRLSSVHLAVLDHQPDNAESISNDGSLRRSDNVDLATEDENERTDEEDAQAQQVGGPEVGVLSSWPMTICLLLYWSAIKGATLDLIPPVPRPMTMMATMKPPSPAPWSRAAGIDVQVRMIRPTM